jgi:hypothetical protein
VSGGAPLPRRRRRALLLPLALLPAAAGAQDPSQRLEFATPDRSRFLLLPIDGSPVVHWAMFAPAGPAEDPPGAPGLSVAVARASLWGALPGEAGEAARAAWRKHEELEERIAASAGPPAETLVAEWHESLAAAVKAGDPFAWQQALRTAPALGPELQVVPGGTVLRLTTTPGALPRVAQQLVARRDGALLTGWRTQLRLAQQERRNERAARRLGELHDELLEIALPGHPAAREVQELADAVLPDVAAARACLARTLAPERTMHVLIGGFDPVELRALLEKRFAQAPEPAQPPRPLPAAPRGERRSDLRGESAAVLVGYPLPAAAPPAAIELLADWLAGGDDAFLPRQLRARALPAISVRIAPRFPDAPGTTLFAIELRDLGRQPAAASAMLAALDAVLAEVVSVGPSAAEQELAAGRRAAAELAARASPRALASLLAVACGTGRTAASVLAPEPIGAAELQSLARDLFAAGRRTIVLQEAVR